MKSQVLRVLTILVINLFMSVSVCLAGTQIAIFVPDAIAVAPGESKQIDIMYDVTAEKQKTTGIAIQIHYNSKFVEKLWLEDTYGEGLVGGGQTVYEDVKDLDGDSGTDKFVRVAWLGIAADWPSFLSLPLKLTRINVKVKGDPDGQTSYITATAQETSINYDFKANRCLLKLLK